MNTINCSAAIIVALHNTVYRETAALILVSIHFRESPVLKHDLTDSMYMCTLATPPFYNRYICIRELIP